MKTKIVSLLSECIKKDVTFHLKINLIRKIMLLLLLGCLSQYSFSINPVDPPSKMMETGFLIISPTASSTNDCSALLNLVTVTITINLTDCPMGCTAPNCQIYLRLYDDNNNTIALIPYTGDCTYTSGELRLDEESNVNVKFVGPSGCSVVWYTLSNHGPVPIGGGTLAINHHYCP